MLDQRVSMFGSTRQAGKHQKRWVGVVSLFPVRLAKNHVARTTHLRSDNSLGFILQDLIYEERSGGSWIHLIQNA
jgi:hypothetical protein